MSVTHVPPGATSWRSTFEVTRAFLSRDWGTVRSYRVPFVMDLLTTGFALFLFFFLARLVDETDVSRYPGMERGYFAFAIVGMAVFRMVQAALTSFSSKLRTEQTTGTLEALLSTPTSPSLVILASATYDVLRGLIAGAALVALGLAVGMRLSASPVALLATAVALVALLALFASLGIAVAAFGMVFKQATGLVGAITTGLALLGGVYFPTEVFPTWLRLIADALPFTWGVDVLRAALVNGALDGLRLAALAASSVLALPVSLWLFHVSADRSRRAGSLGQY